jgi:hypothetical protein
LSNEQTAVKRLGGTRWKDGLPAAPYMRQIDCGFKAAVGFMRLACEVDSSVFGCLQSDCLSGGVAPGIYILACEFYCKMVQVGIAWIQP